MYGEDHLCYPCMFELYSDMLTGCTWVLYLNGRNNHVKPARLHAVWHLTHPRVCCLFPDTKYDQHNNLVHHDRHARFEPYCSWTAPQLWVKLSCEVWCWCDWCVMDFCHSKLPITMDLVYKKYCLCLLESSIGENEMGKIRFLRGFFNQIQCKIVQGRIADSLCEFDEDFWE